MLDKQLHSPVIWSHEALREAAGRQSQDRHSYRAWADWLESSLSAQTPNLMEEVVSYTQFDLESGALRQGSKKLSPQRHNQ